MTSPHCKRHGEKFIVCEHHSRQGGYESCCACSDDAVCTESEPCTCLVPEKPLADMQDQPWWEKYLTVHEGKWEHCCPIEGFYYAGDVDKIVAEQARRIREEMKKECSNAIERAYRQHTFEPTREVCFLEALQAIKDLS